MPRISFSLKMLIVSALFTYAIVLSAPLRSFPAIYSSYVDPLDVGTCPRALGMGGAYVAAADDVNSIFLNPAGLSFAKNWGMMLGTSTVTQETSNTSFGMYFAISTDEAFGFGFMSSITTNPLTAAPSREPVTGRMITEDAKPLTETYSNSVAVLSYGVRLGKYIGLPIIDNTSFGISLKAFVLQLESTEEISHGSGFDVDIGLIYKMNSWLKFGLLGQDIFNEDQNGKLTWPDGYVEAIPYKVKGGISTKILGKESMLGLDQDLSLNLEVEQNHYAKDVPNLYHGGIEWWPVNYMAVRCGVDQMACISTKAGEKYVIEDNYTGGLGFKFGDFTADLAYHRYGEILDDTMSYASLSYTFPGFAENVAEIQAAPITQEVVQAVSTEEYLSIKSPADRSIVYGDSVLVSCEVLSGKVIQVEVNGNKIDITGPPSREAGEAGKNITTSISIPSTGKFTVKIKCFDVIGTLLKDYKIRLVRFPVFKDVAEGFWARDKIIISSAINLFSGYPDGTFKPNKTITRAELASIIVKAAGHSTPEAITSIFKDVKDNNWAAFYIMKGVDLKYLSGYSDDTFRPSKPITRAEGVSIISRFAGLAKPKAMEEAPFDDVPMTHWAAGTIASAKDAGLLGYLNNKPFNPNKQMTRAEAAVILLQTKAVKDKATELLNWEVGF